MLYIKKYYGIELCEDLHWFCDSGLIGTKIGKCCVNYINTAKVL